MSFIQIALLAGSSVLSVVLICVLGYFAYLAYIHHLYAHIPGPKRDSFILGNIPTLAKECRLGDNAYIITKDTFIDSEQTKLKPLFAYIMVEWCETFGDTWVVYIMHRPLVVTRDKEALKTILMTGDQHDFPKSSESALRKLAGNRYLYDGLATATDHDTWYLRRKVLDPAFHRKQLQQAIDVFNTSGNILVHELMKHAENDETFKMQDLFHRVTIDVILRTMFSMNNEGFNSEFHEEAMDFVNNTFGEVQKSFSQIFPEWNPVYFFYRRRVQKMLMTFREKARKVIEERERLILNDEHPPEDMLTTMIRSYLGGNDGYTYEIMIDEFCTIVIAGMETSANTLSLLFMELSRQPEMWQRLVAEVDEVVGTKEFISNEDSSKLSYTQQLIKETLRCHPPVNGMLRMIAKETNFGGYMIPANSLCILAAYASHMNETVTPNPKKFDPDRFDPEKTERVTALGFLSFSLGARNCIGQVFAQMEMRVLIAKFVQHFIYKPDASEKYLLAQKATLYPLSELKGKVLLREHHQ